MDRRFQNGLLLTNSYTLSRSKDLANENTRDRHADRLRSELGAIELRSPHNYVLTAIYELPWGPGKRWMSEGMLGTIVGGWQLSGLFVAQSGTAADHHRQRRAAQHARQHRVREPASASTGARRPGPGNPVLRSQRLRAARRRRAGQHAAEQRPRGAGLLAARRVALQALQHRRRAASPSSASTRSTRRTPCAGGTPTPASAPRRATRSARSPARPAASASSASADASCSGHGADTEGSS